MPASVGGLRWNPTLARYIDARGRMVSTVAVRRALDASIRNAQGRARQYAEQLRAGDLTLAEWEMDMRVLIKDVQIWSVAGAAGGWAQLGPAEYGRIGSLVRDQYEYLYAFTQSIATGRTSLAAVGARAVLYVEAGRRSYEMQQLVADRDAGLDEEANTLGPADHCGECPDWTARGWLPVGTIPLPGDRECIVRCKCMITRRMSPAARDARARRRRTAGGTAGGTAPTRQTWRTTAGQRAAAARSNEPAPVDVSADPFGQSGAQLG